MRKLLILALLIPALASAGTAYLIEPGTVYMNNKVCKYDYLGTLYVTNIPPTQFCPLTLEIDDE